MNAPGQERKDRIWELIEAEKKRDRTIQRISKGAWIVTFLAILFIILRAVPHIWWAWQEAMRGVAPFDIVLAYMEPAVLAVGGVSLMVAVLSTVAVLVRLRAASLDEIRLRLSALEQMLVDEAEADDD